MVLHIALEGIDGTGKTTMTQKHEAFFKKKGYKVTSAIQPSNEDIITILITKTIQIE